jgi:hypothetical protein
MRRFKGQLIEMYFCQILSQTFDQWSKTLIEKKSTKLVPEATNVELNNEIKVLSKLIFINEM